MKLGDHPSAVQWLEKASKLESLNREVSTLVIVVACTVSCCVYSLMCVCLVYYMQDESSHVEIEELLLQLSSV